MSTTPETFLLQSLFTNSYDYTRIVKHTKDIYFVFSPTLSAFKLQNQGGHGPALQQISDMYSRGINIVLCTTHPEIIFNQSSITTLDELRCVDRMVLDSCLISNLISTNMIPSLVADRPNKDIPNNPYSCRISEDYFSSYFYSETAWTKQTDFLENSLHSIKKKAVSAPNFVNRQQSIKLILVKKFVPVCLTLSDPKQDNGLGLIDFKLPFTDDRIYIEVLKEKNDSVFNSLYRSFKSIISLDENTNECSKDVCEVIDIS